MRRRGQVPGESPAPQYNEPQSGTRSSGKCTSAEGWAPTKSTLNAPVEDPKASRTLRRGDGEGSGTLTPDDGQRSADGKRTGSLPHDTHTHTHTHTHTQKYQMWQTIEIRVVELRAWINKALRAARNAVRSRGRSEMPWKHPREMAKSGFLRLFGKWVRKDADKRAEEENLKDRENTQETELRDVEPPKQRAREADPSEGIGRDPGETTQSDSRKKKRRPIKRRYPRYFSPRISGSR